MYSQNLEEHFIKQYFGDFIGVCLSIGENTGTHLSNVRQLIEDGWAAVCVEPSPEAFDQLQDIHKFNEKVYCINVAIADYCGRSFFHHSGEQLGIGDTSLVSTLLPEETNRWKGHVSFEEIEVEVVDFNTLLAESPHKTFDMISIDAEGYDTIILKQMDLNKLCCKLICIEWNSIQKNFDEMNSYIVPFGFHLIHSNAENLIYAR